MTEALQLIPSQFELSEHNKLPRAVVNLPELAFRAGIETVEGVNPQSSEIVANATEAAAQRLPADTITNPQEYGVQVAQTLIEGSKALQAVNDREGSLNHFASGAVTKEFEFKSKKYIAFASVGDVKIHSSIEGDLTDPDVIINDEGERELQKVLGDEHLLITSYGFKRLEANEVVEIVDGDFDTVVSEAEIELPTPNNTVKQETQPATTEILPEVEPLQFADTATLGEIRAQMKEATPKQIEATRKASGLTLEEWSKNGGLAGYAILFGRGEADKPAVVRSTTSEHLRNWGDYTQAREVSEAHESFTVEESDIVLNGLEKTLSQARAEFDDMVSSNPEQINPNDLRKATVRNGQEWYWWVDKKGRKHRIAEAAYKAVVGTSTRRSKSGLDPFKAQTNKLPVVDIRLPKPEDITIY